MFLIISIVFLIKYAAKFLTILFAIVLSHFIPRKSNWTICFTVHRNFKRMVILTVKFIASLLLIVYEDGHC